MSSVERTITVPKPLAVVWAHVTDFTTTEQWDPPTKECRRTTSAGEDGRGVGTVYQNTSSMGPKDVEITYTVTEYVPQERFQLRGETPSFELLDTITFSGDATSTTLTYHAEFDPQGIAKVTTPLLPLGLSRLGDKTADSLEEHLRSLPDR